MTLLQKEQVHKGTDVHLKILEKALWEDLSFTNGIHPEMVSTILDHIVVFEKSSDKQIYLEVYPWLDQRASPHFQRSGLVVYNTPLITGESTAALGYTSPVQYRTELGL